MNQQPVPNIEFKHTEYNKYDFLWMLYNKYGATDLKLSYNYKHDGELKFSKWVSYESLLHLDRYNYDPDLHMTPLQFMDKATHRTILDIELLIDIDDKAVPVPLHFNDKGMLNASYYEFSTVKAKAQWILLTLNKYNAIPTIYFTGSKGYHLSLILSELRNKERSEREKIKEQLLWAYGGDLAKKSDKCMISLENSTHWKSGITKDKVRFDDMFSYWT